MGGQARSAQTHDRCITVFSIGNWPRSNRCFYPNIRSNSSFRIGHNSPHSLRTGVSFMRHCDDVRSLFLLALCKKNNLCDYKLPRPHFVRWKRNSKDYSGHCASSARTTFRWQNRLTLSKEGSWQRARHARWLFRPCELRTGRKALTGNGREEAQ